MSCGCDDAATYFKYMTDSDMIDEEFLSELDGSLTLRRAIKLYELVVMPARNLAARTREEYGKDLRLFASWCDRRGLLRVDQVTLPVLEAYQAEMDAHGYASSSRQRKTYALRGLLAFFYGHGVIRQNIGRRLIPPLRVRREPRFLTQAEYQALKQACRDSPRDSAIVEVLLQTGMRRGELARLTLDDVFDLPERLSQSPDGVGLIRIRRRGGEVAMPLNFRACRAIQRYLAVRPSSPWRALFLSRNGTALSPRAILNLIKHYSAEIGLSGIGVHTLRHTHGTHHVLQGTDLNVIKENMGHADISTTEQYVVLAGKARRKALQDHAL